MTYRPTNILVKNIIRKLAPATRYPNTAAIFQLLRIVCAYRCDTNLHYSLVRSALNNTTSTYNYRGTFSCGRNRCNTCLHTNASAVIAKCDITVQSKYIFVKENVVCVIKCRTCNKVYIGETGRRLVDTDLNFASHGCLTQISRLAAILHPPVTTSATCWSRSSVLALLVQQKGAALRPG